MGYKLSHLFGVGQTDRTRCATVVLKALGKRGSHLVGRGELTEEAWRFIAPLLPASGRGGQWRNHRTVINGILWKLRTGAPWRDLLERYGP